MNKTVLKDPLVYNIIIIAAAISSFMSMLFSIMFGLPALVVIFYYVMPCLCMIAVVYLHFFSKITTLIPFFVAALFMALLYSDIISELLSIFGLSALRFDFVTLINCMVYFLLFVFDICLFVMAYGNDKYRKIFYIIKFIILVVLALNLIRVSSWENFFFMFFHIVTFLTIYKVQNTDTVKDENTNIVKEKEDIEVIEE